MNSNRDENKKIKYNAQIQERIETLQEGIGIKNEEISHEIGIPLDKYTYLKRKDQNGPRCKYVPKKLLHDICTYYNCTWDYLMGEADDPHKDKKGRTITNPIQYIYKGEMNKVHKLLDQLNENDRNLLIKFLLHTPKYIQEPIITGIRTIIEDLVNNSLSTLIQSSTTVKGFRFSARAGIHDEDFMNTLICIQHGESNIFQKSYHNALTQYCIAIKYVIDAEELSVPLIQLYSLSCGHIGALQNNWKKFPKDLGILDLIKITDPQEYKEENRRQLDEIIEALSKKNKQNTLPPDTDPQKKKT